VQHLDAILGNDQLDLWVVSFYIYADVAGSYLFHSTCFVIADGCIVLIQFYFDVLVFVYWFCFFSNAEFNVLLTVQRLDAILGNDQLGHYPESLILIWSLSLQ
jgi:hypothetical protein